MAPLLPSPRHRCRGDWPGFIGSLELCALTLVLSATVLLTASSATACDGPTVSSPLPTWEIVATGAATAGLTGLSAAVLVKLWEETEPGGQATLRWHLAALASGAAHAVAGVAVTMTGLCGSGVEQRVFPVLGGVHAVALVATIGLPLLWHANRAPGERPPSSSWTLAPMFVPDARSGVRRGVGFSLRW